MAFRLVTFWSQNLGEPHPAWRYDGFESRPPARTTFKQYPEGPRFLRFPSVAVSNGFLTVNCSEGLRPNDLALRSQ